MAAGVQEHDTFKNLIRIAEAKADDLTEIEKFDFLDYLENGGVVMPTEQLTLFTDAKTSQQIQKLAVKHDELLQIASQNAQGELDELRQARFDELVAEQDTSEWLDGAPDDGEDDGLGIVDEPVYKSVEFGKLWTQVFAEFPAAEVKEIKEATAIIDQIGVLEKEIWESRIIVDIEGQQPADNREMEMAIQEELRKPLQSQLDADAKREYSDTRRADSLTAACITRIQIPHKGIDQDLTEKRMPQQVAHRFLVSLPQSEVNKILLGVQMLSTVAAIVEPSVDAGFPGGPADEAGERPSESGDQDGAVVSA